MFLLSFSTTIFFVSCCCDLIILALIYTPSQRDDKTYQNPKPELVPSSPPLPSSPPSRFLHRLQTSITRSIIKLECFLRPFFKTRSHDESAHTFKSSLRFLEVPQKGVFKKLFFCIFLPHFLTRLVLSDPLKLFQKSWELSGM